MCCIKSLLSGESTARVLITENKIVSLVNATGLGQQEIAEFQREFLKDFPKGVLTRKEFCKLFENQLINDQEDERRTRKLKKFAGHVYNALNNNSNGTLSFSDFLVFYSTSSFGNLKEKIKLAFKIYDHNKDNVIDKSEMRQMLEILFDLTMIGQAEGKKKSAQSTVKIIMKKLDKIDTNRDKLIQFDEFMNACINDKMICSILVDPMFNC